MGDGVTIRQFQAFLLTAEKGSVTAAATELGISQPAASQNLRELEKVMGVRLLERSGGRMRVTAAGQALVAPARRVLLAIRDADLAAADYRSTNEGNVRVGMGATACIHFLPPTLTQVKALMPHLQISITIGNTSDILRQIEQGELDLGLVTMPVSANPMLTFKELMRDPLIALIPEPLAPTGGTITAGQLAAIPLILYDSGGHTRSATDDWFRKASITPTPLMELGSVEAIKVLVGSGLGASVLPGMALGADVPGAVRRKLRPVATRGLALVSRRDRTPDRGMRLFINKLEAAATLA